MDLQAIDFDSLKQAKLLRDSIDNNTDPGAKRWAMVHDQVVHPLYKGIGARFYLYLAHLQ